MIKNKSLRVVLSGLFAAFGLILPYFTAHAFGIAGTILLPMHIPVLLCGLLCGPMFGGFCGVIVPVLSSLMTNMPPVYPMLPIMTPQLATMGLLSGLLYRKLNLKIYIALPVSVICGWISYGLMFAVLLLANSELKAPAVTAAIVQGIPGLIVQLVLIPAVLIAIKKFLGKTNFQS